MSIHKYKNGRYVIRFRSGNQNRTLTVSRKNLAAYGLSPPTTEKGITKRHASALHAEIQRLLLNGDQAPSNHAKSETIQISAERYLDQLQASVHHITNKKRWLLGPDQSKPRTRGCPGLTQLVGSVPASEVLPDDIIAFRPDFQTGGVAAVL